MQGYAARNAKEDRRSSFSTACQAVSHPMVMN